MLIQHDRLTAFVAEAAGEVADHLVKANRNRRGSLSVGKAPIHQRYWTSPRT